MPGVEVKENAGAVELPEEQKRKDIKKNSFTSHCSCSICLLVVISQDFGEQINALIVFHPIVSNCIILQNQMTYLLSAAPRSWFLFLGECMIIKTSKGEK